MPGPIINFEKTFDSGRTISAGPLDGDFKGDVVSHSGIGFDIAISWNRKTFHIIAISLNLKETLVEIVILNLGFTYFWS